jgi:AraC family ethanolamine operon transcriptional activator
MYKNGSCQHASARGPQYSIVTTDTHDAVTHGRCFVGWNHTFEHVERRPFRGKVTQLRLGPIQVIQERLENSMVYRGGTWEGSVMFASFLSTSEHIFLGGHDATPNTVSACTWEKQGPAYVAGPNESITVLVQQDLLKKHLDDVLEEGVSWEALLANFLTSNVKAVEEFQQEAMNILRQVLDQPECLGNPSSRALLQNQVLDMLSKLISESDYCPQKLPPPSTRSYIIDKAINFMSAHVSESMSMNEVSSSIRVSPRTLRYSFEELIGVSPRQYLLALRLNRVRCDLEKANSPGRVRCIAERYGFAHMGRFAAFYYQTFGEMPSDTCKRAAPGKEFITV